VLISTVRSRQLVDKLSDTAAVADDDDDDDVSSNSSDSSGDFGFLSEQKLLNTALTRAR